MIGSLRGRIASLSSTSALVEVNGVGYRVNASPNTLGGLRIGEETLLYIHDHIREDAHDLFGFPSEDELALFERLIGVSGVGPKAGMSILSVGSVDAVHRAIMAGDLTTLTSAPGVGMKIAQKIVLELKDKLGSVARTDEGELRGEAEAVEALQALGYNLREAREALKNIPDAVVDTGEKIKLALKQLGK